MTRKLRQMLAALLIFSAVTALHAQQSP